MGKDADAIREVLERDLMNYCQNIARHAVHQMANDMTKTAKTAIDLFYSDYKPRFYIRNWNFRHTYRRYYKNHGDRFSGGVELLVDALPSKDYSDPTYEVFDRVYAGFHGMASAMDNKIHNVIDRSTNKPTGETARHIRFIPPRMNPSPMDILLKKYDDIAANKDQYFENAKKIAQRYSYEYLKF